MAKIKCPLGHKQKSRSGFLLNPDVSGRVCDVCGVIFVPRVTNKELAGEFDKKKKLIPTTCKRWGW